MKNGKVIQKVEDIPVVKNNKMVGMMGGILAETESIMHQSNAVLQDGKFHSAEGGNFLYPEKVPNKGKWIFGIAIGSAVAIFLIKRNNG